MQGAQGAIDAEGQRRSCFFPPAQHATQVPLQCALLSLLSIIMHFRAMVRAKEAVKAVCRTPSFQSQGLSPAHQPAVGSTSRHLQLLFKDGGAHNMTLPSAGGKHCCPLLMPPRNSSPSRQRPLASLCPCGLI